MVAVQQPPSDKKTYRLIKLQNGLTGLLIHDPAVAAGLHSDQTQDGSGADVSMSEGSDSAGSEGSEDDSADEEEGSEGSGSEGDSSEEDGGAKGRGKKGGAAPSGSKKAAAALAVGVGSFTDPSEMPGLAHYLEHMLFMGSEKYPDENDYDAFLNKHGGSSNAYTELEYTNYHLDVAPAHLEGALDRLAQFFVKPLFLAGALEREVQAVDSEFKGVLQSDHSRLAQLMCHTCRAGHVYNKFSWGNLKSLWEQPRQAGLDVRQKIIDFYSAQYSAPRMSLAVLGGQDLDTLESWVQASFGGILTGTAGPPASFEHAGLPFEGPPCLYVSPAVKDHHEVTVSFQLPCLRHNYRNKPEHYISHLVGHEGPGSLLSTLKARGWALELCAGIDDDGYSFNTAAYLFTVNIVLTESGLAAGPGFGLAPVALLFQYIKLLTAHTTTEPQSWVYDELRAISDMKFRFLEEEDSCDFVTRLASTMGWVEPQHLLAADYLHQHWQPDKVLELLRLMQPTSSNYRIDLLSKSYPTLKQQLTQQQQQQQQQPDAAGGAIEPLHEPWFGMEAIKWQLPERLTAEWAAADVSSDLALPPPNPYIPTYFTVKPDQQQPAAEGAAAPDQQQQQIAALPPWVLAPVGGRPASVSVLMSAPPSMILDKPGVRLWHKLAVRYGQPRLVTYWRLSSPVAAATARHSVLCALWLRLVEEAQAEDAYLADVAGLHWSSCPEGVCGLEVRMDGFSHKLHVLATRVFKALAGAQVKAASFPSVCEELMRRYRNALLKPSHAANALRLQLLSGGPAWSHDELAAALAEVKGVDEVKAFAAEYLSCCHLEGLVMGNATAAEAAQLCTDVAAVINNAAAAAAAAAEVAQSTGGEVPRASARGLVLSAAARHAEVCVQLPAGVEVLHTAPARNPDEDNCAVEVYYQVGLSSTDLRLRVLADLGEQVVSEALYDSLRTKQQLGYTVSSGARLTHGVTGFCVVVVSAAFDAAAVEQRIEAFMHDFQHSALQAMTAEEFSRHKASLISNKLQTDMSLGQEGDRAWEQVFTSRYEFVTREQEAAILQDITLQDLQAFYASYLAPRSPSRRKLCVRITPVGKQDQSSDSQPATAVADTAQPAVQHVQHEYGVLHVGGEHAHHSKQRQPHAEPTCANGTADVNEAAAGAVAAGGGDGAPRSKRVRRSDDNSVPGQSDASASLSTMQVAPVQEVQDVNTFKASAAQYGVYQTVQPQLAEDSRLQGSLQK